MKKIKVFFMYTFLLKSFVITPGRAVHWNPVHDIRFHCMNKDEYAYAAIGRYDFFQMQADCY